MSTSQQQQPMQLHQLSTVSASARLAVCTLKAWDEHSMPLHSLIAAQASLAIHWYTAWLA